MSGAISQPMSNEGFVLLLAGVTSTSIGLGLFAYAFTPSFLALKGAEGIVAGAVIGSVSGSCIAMGVKAVQLTADVYV